MLHCIRFISSFSTKELLPVPKELTVSVLLGGRGRERERERERERMRVEYVITRHGTVLVKGSKLLVGFHEIPSI